MKRSGFIRRDGYFPTLASITLYNVQRLTSALSPYAHRTWVKSLWRPAAGFHSTVARPLLVRHALAHARTRAHSYIAYRSSWCLVARWLKVDWALSGAPFSSHSLRKWSPSSVLVMCDIYVTFCGQTMSSLFNFAFPVFMVLIGWIIFFFLINLSHLRTMFALWITHWWAMMWEAENIVCLFLKLFFLLHFWLYMLISPLIILFIYCESCTVSPRDWGWGMSGGLISMQLKSSKII